MVEADVAFFEENLSTADGKKRLDLLPKYLNIAQIWISSILLGDVQEVHQCIVL